jgi:signal transduction histidine kinase
VVAAPKPIRVSWLPSGHGLPPGVWRRRQRGIVILLWLHAVGLFVFALVRGNSVLHSFTEASIVAILAAAAASPIGGVRMRSAIATLGLISCSAILVHLSGGVIEAHFHFFAMIGIITLYQDWVPFGLAIAFVALHHGVASTVDAGSVYNHYAALNNPWKWAAIHGMFVLGASCANIFAWHFNEQAAGQTEAYKLRLEEAERRRRSALEINDNVVQGLAVVTSALALGQEELARDAAARTITAARAIISDMLGDDPDGIPAGSLRRESAAVVAP